MALPISPVDLAIDFGTNNIRIYVKNRGIVIYESSVLMIESESRQLRAVGDEAVALLGRAPKNVSTIHPVKDGVIVDYESAQMLLHYLVSKAIGSHNLRQPRAVVTIPGELSKVEKSTVRNAALKSGIRTISMQQQVFAAAMGAGLQVYEPVGNLVVLTGAGTTEVSLISMGGIVISKSIRTAGNSLNNAIIAALKADHSLQITDFAAEQLKLDLADAQPDESIENIAVVRGRDLITGMPTTVDVTKKEICKAIQEPLAEILGAIKWVLNRIPPELTADVLHKGICLVGGTANLPNLAERIQKEFGVPVYIPNDNNRDPGEFTVLGAGYMADDFDNLRIGREDD